jgi:hypothetical protein
MFGLGWQKSRVSGKSYRNLLIRETDDRGVVGFVETTFFVPIYAENSGLTDKQKEKQVIKFLKQQVTKKGKKNDKG